MILPSELPLLLLDVDGVLNPYAAPACPPGYRNFGLFEGEEPVRLDLSQGAWVRELASVFTVVWATGWGPVANEILAPLYGFEPLPVIGLPEVPFAPEGKVLEIDAFCGDRPVVWIDDCHTQSGLRWAADRQVRTLLLSIDPAEGWTRQVVDQACAWAAHLPGAACTGLSLSPACRGPARPGQ